MPMTPPVDGPPPSPATDPTAAREAGQPMPISGLASPIQMQGSGPDLSGILMLGQKIEEGMLSIAQAVPAIADGINQAKSMFMAALAQFASQSGSSNGSMPGAGATGQVVTQAGAQFPGGGQGSARPF